MNAKTEKDDIVSWLCKIARIELSENEKKEFQKDIPKIIEFFNKIREVDVSGLAPTFHVLEITNVVRLDASRQYPSSKLSKYLKIKENNYFMTRRLV